MQILKVHVIDGKFRAQDLVDGMEVATVGGVTLLVSIDAATGIVTFTPQDCGPTATVLIANFGSCKATMHLIDTVLTPGLGCDSSTFAAPTTPEFVFVDPAPVDPAPVDPAPVFAPEAPIESPIDGPPDVTSDAIIPPSGFDPAAGVDPTDPGPGVLPEGVPVVMFAGDLILPETALAMDGGAGVLPETDDVMEDGFSVMGTQPRLVSCSSPSALLKSIAELACLRAWRPYTMVLGH